MASKAKRKQTLSDDPLERRIYEEAGKEEEEFLIQEFQELLADMPPPPGWRKKKGPGRPRKKRRGAKEEFTWQAMLIVVLLMKRHKLHPRTMHSHLRANPGLCQRLGIPRAPSASTIDRATRRFPEAWLKKVNARLLGTAKGGSVDGLPRSEPVWIVLE